VVAFNLCTSEALLGRWLVLLDTGSGKTALCFTIACSFASKNHQVLIINSSDELTFRDFKLAEKSSRVTQILVNFIDGSNDIVVLREGITYLSYKTFANLIQKLDKDAIKNVVAILDEFDSAIFSSENSL
jgi:archaellum biogenesis ATPase FlaH